MNPLLSIIIPVYNVESFLGKCLDSVVHQTYTNIEIILINDGSTDGSGAICDAYAKKDERIQVIHQENTGASVARKNGFQVAKGEYIGCVDSDDWIELDMYEKMMGWALEYNVPLVCVNMTIETVDETFFLPSNVSGLYHRNKKEEFCNSDHIFLYDQYGKLQLTGSCNNQLFQRDIFEKYYMTIADELIYFEDFACFFAWFPFLDRVYVSNEYLYHYNRYNESSISTIAGTMQKRVTDIFSMYHYLKERYTHHEMHENLMEQLQIHITKRMLYEDMVELHEALPQFRIATEWLQEYQNIVIYGAGDVGQSYYKQIEKFEHMHIVSVVDKNRNGQQLDDGTTIASPSALENMAFDAIVIAVYETHIADAIKKDLIVLYGVPSEKIIWNTPQSTIDVLSQLFPY